MRYREEAKKLKEKELMLAKMQKANAERRTMYEKFEKQKKEEEEDEESKKSKKLLEDRYLLSINDIKVEKQIGSGGSARVCSVEIATPLPAGSDFFATPLESF